MAWKGTEHRFTQNNISAYIDGRLDAHSRSRLERHIAECSRCAADLESMRQTKALLAQMPQRAVPRSFKLPDSVQAERVRYQRLNQRYRLLRSASAITAVLVTVLLAGGAILGYFGGAPAPQATMFACSTAPANAESGAAGSFQVAATAAPAYPAPNELGPSAKNTPAAYPAKEAVAAVPEAQGIETPPLKLAVQPQETPAEETPPQAAGTLNAEGAEMPEMPTLSGSEVARITGVQDSTPTTEASQLGGRSATTVPAQPYSDTIPALTDRSQATAVPAPEQTVEVVVPLAGSVQGTAAPKAAAPPEQAPQESAPTAEQAPQSPTAGMAIWRIAVVVLTATLLLLLGGWVWTAHRRSH